ncbi:hypothetical protein P7L68_22380 [Tistrella mobilis]|uniref:hypothetical protein n=1 Tax=Tistrella mobilis TaxID=171437 RepID=UPI003558C9E8
MFRRRLHLLISMAFSVLVFTVIYGTQSPYDIYMASTIISVEQPGSEAQQQSALPLFGGGQGKRITEFFEVVNGITLAEHLLQFDFVKAEVDKWRRGQMMARLMKPEFQDIQVEDVRGFINKSVQLDTLDQNGIVKIDMTTSDRAVSENIIKEILRYYISWRREDEIRTIKAQMDVLSDDLAQLSASQVSNAISGQITRLMTREVIVRADLSYGIRVIDQVYAPRGIVNTSPVIIAIIAIMAGAFIYYTLTFLKMLRSEIARPTGE